MVIPSTMQPSLNAHTHAQEQLSCKPMVTVYCSVCDNGKELDQNAAEADDATLTTPDRPTPDKPTTEIVMQQTTPAPSEDIFLQRTQPAATEAQILTVKVSCPVCSEASHINTNKLWQRNNKNRFSQITCMLCQSKTVVGNWCSSHDAEKTTVKEWLQTHSYNGSRSSTQ